MAISLISTTMKIRTENMTENIIAYSLYEILNIGQK